MSTIGGPLVAGIAALTDDARAALIGRLRVAVEPYETVGGLELPGLVLVLSGSVRVTTTDP